MMEYKQDDYLMLSGIQHYAFCKRQWALIHIENLWEDNYHTAIGNIFHEKVHDGMATEKRGSIITSRAMPIYSATLGISGECDIVEFHLDKYGVEIKGRTGRYLPYPIEYKKGAPKQTKADVLQLVAQAICLEDMFCCSINCGYLFYGQTKRRKRIEIHQGLKEEVTASFRQMHSLAKRGHTPKVKPSKNCNSCSLKNLCLPVLCKKKSVKEYILKKLNEE